MHDHEVMVGSQSRLRSAGSMPTAAIKLISLVTEGKLHAMGIGICHQGKCLHSGGRSSTRDYILWFIATFSVFPKLRQYDVCKVSETQLLIAMHLEEELSTRTLWPAAHDNSTCFRLPTAGLLAASCASELQNDIEIYLALFQHSV